MWELLALVNRNSSPSLLKRPVVPLTSHRWCLLCRERCYKSCWFNVANKLRYLPLFSVLQLSVPSKVNNVNTVVCGANLQVLVHQLGMSSCTYCRITAKFIFCICWHNEALLSMKLYYHVHFIIVLPPSWNDVRVWIWYAWIWWASVHLIFSWLSDDWYKLLAIWRRWTFL